MWFTPSYNMQLVGIVTVDFEDGCGIQQFIGTGNGVDQAADAQNIAHWGARFVSPRKPDEFVRRT